MSIWPSDRPITYLSNQVWGWDGSAYSWFTPGVDVEVAPILAAGGGRYKQKFIVIGKDTIYFGDMT